MDSDIIYNIDGDMFPINQISLREFIGDYPIAGVPQSRLNSHYVVNYLWNGLFGFKPNEIKWDLFQRDTHLITDDPKTGKPFPGISTDVGGTMFFYLNEEPEYKKIIHLWSGSWNKETLINNGILIPEVLIKQLEKDPRNLNGFYFSEEVQCTIIW